MNALVSVVIPVYNGAEYLEATVNTILAQDYDNVEILLINDGSKDNSEQLINTLVENHSSIKGFHKQNGGVAAARNYGIERASGEFVAFCDQDDFWLPTKLSKQVPLFENPKVGVVYCGSIADYPHLNKQEKTNFESKYSGDVFEELIKANMFTCCAVVSRKNLLLKEEAFDDDRELMGVDDWLAWLKLSLVCEFDFVAEHLAIHVFHGDNYSSNEEKMHNAEVLCIEKIKQIAEGYNKEVDWSLIQQNLHIRYANTYIHNGMFKLAGETLLKASKFRNSRKLLVKSRLLKAVPNFVWQSIQKIKRAI